VTQPITDTDIWYYGSCIYSDCSVKHRSHYIQRHVSTQDTADAISYATYCCCQWAQLHCRPWRQSAMQFVWKLP